jgi:molecular chaperone GrpE
VLDLTVRNNNIVLREEFLAYLSCNQSRLRYLQADFLNLQRNAAREKEQTKDYAISRFAGDLLETVDVLSIALKSIPPEAVNPPSTSSEPSESQHPNDTSSTLPKSHATYLRELHTGVEMTHRLLLQTLFKYQVKPFDPTGDQFDPNLHEALYQHLCQGWNLERLLTVRRRVI